MNTTPSIISRIVPKRRIEGISAMLLPFHGAGQIDFDSFAAHLERTVRAGLIPAVNMDTGYVNLLTAPERRQVLEKTREVMAGNKFVAGAFIEGQDGEPYALYAREVEQIQAFGGTPILFQSSALKRLSSKDIVSLYKNVAAHCVEMLAFELGEMFAPFGQIYDLDVVRGWMEIPQLVGIKHSSLNRELEWQRLVLRDEVRPNSPLRPESDIAILREILARLEIFSV